MNKQSTDAPYTGLSYTSFAYHNLVVSTAEAGLKAISSTVTVSVNITNTGSVPGADIPQLYLGFPSSAGEPPKQLKGFRKTPILAPGATTTVNFLLTDRDVSIWELIRGKAVQLAELFYCKLRITSAYISVSESDFDA